MNCRTRRRHNSDIRDSRGVLFWGRRSGVIHPDSRANQRMDVIRHTILLTKKEVVGGRRLERKKTLQINKKMLVSHTGLFIFDGILEVVEAVKQTG